MAGVGRGVTPTENVVANHGKFYSAWHSDAGMSDTETKNYVITTTSSDFEVFFKYRVGSKNSASVKLFEGPVISDGATGTDLTLRCRNRIDYSTGSDTDHGAKIDIDIYAIADVMSDGDVLINHYGGGTDNIGCDAWDPYWILAKDTKYLLKVTTHAASSYINTVMQWSWVAQ